MINLILDEMEEKMGKTIESFKEDLKTVRTGRANPQMLDRIRFEYYGEPTPINQIASLSVQEGKTIVIKPYDRNSVKDIEKAINASDINLPVQNGGDVLRITVPSLTGDTRKQLCKDVDKMAEESKVQIRNIRRDANDDIKKDKELPEDTQKGFLDDIQKATDKSIEKIEKIADEKQKEIMTI